MSSQTIVLHSEARDANTAIYAPSWKLDFSINANKCRIKQFLFPYSFYTVNDSNSTIVFNEGGSNITATLTSGTYNIDQLATEMKTRLDASSGLGRTYTVSYSLTTLKLTITCASSFTVYWSLSLASKLCGFSHVTSTSGTSHTGSYPVCLTVPYIHIFSNTLDDCQTFTNNGPTNLVAIVPVEVSPFQIQNYLFPDNDWRQLPKKSMINRISFNFTDQDGANIPWNSHDDYIIVVEFDV